MVTVFLCFYDSDIDQVFFLDSLYGVVNDKALFFPFVIQSQYQIRQYQLLSKSLPNRPINLYKPLEQFFVFVKCFKE